MEGLGESSSLLHDLADPIKSSDKHVQYKLKELDLNASDGEFEANIRQ